MTKSGFRQVGPKSERAGPCKGRHRIATAVSAKQQRVTCVRASAIGVRLPSPRALTSYIYINSKIAICIKLTV